MQSTKDILKQVKKIEITTKKLVDGIITGNYHSIFKGQGIEFSEIRDYRAGDDVRSIDWNVTARFNQPYIKEFIEERDLQVYFAIDMSGSANFGNNIPKKRKAIEVAASLMFGAMKNNDKVGAFLFTDKIEQFIPARKGKKHILKLISIIIGFEAKSKTTDLKSSLTKILNIIKKKSVIFIVSDFFDKGFKKPLNFLSRRHDVVGINISDAREMEIPDVGLIELEDEETGEQLLVDTSDDEFRNNFKKQMKQKKRYIKKKFTSSKAELLELDTDSDYGLSLKKFFMTRKKKVMHSGRV